jgi:hypothetical protein
MFLSIYSHQLYICIWFVSYIVFDQETEKKRKSSCSSLFFLSFFLFSSFYYNDRMVVCNINMSWDRTCCVSTTSSNGGSASSSIFSPSSLTRGYSLPLLLLPPSSSSSSSSFFFFFFFWLHWRSIYKRKRERKESIWLPLLHDYHHFSPHLYSSFFFLACQCVRHMLIQ